MPITITPVTTQTTTITAGLYNTIQSETKYVLNTLYGGDLTTFSISTGTLITPNYWTNLKTDIEKAYTHQTGVALATPSGKTPITGGLIYADYVNTLITATNFISANTNTHAANQMSIATEGSGAAVSRRTTSWGSTLTHQVLYTWTTSTEAGYFFNLGGALIAQESYVAGTAGSGTTETAWMSMINDIQALASNTANWFTASNYYSGTPVSISTSANAFDSLDLTFSKVSDTQVKFDAVYRHLGWFAELDLVSTATYRISGSSISAERPQVQNSLFLGDAGAYVPFPTKTLTFPSAPSAFSWYSNKSSPTQVIYLSNAGTVDLTVTDIQFSSNNGVVPHYSYGWGSTLPRVIGPGQTSTINLYYTGKILGTTQQTVTVISNNDKGTKVLQFDCTTVAPLFEISTDPTSWSVTTGSLVVQNQFFPVIPDGYDIAEYTASVTGTGYRLDNNLTSFTTTGTVEILSTGSGASVLFNPTSLTTGTYYGTLSLSAKAINGLTSSTSVPLTVNYTAPENKNLGVWKSPAAQYNAVVGISYDTVDGVNYITLGVTGSLSSDPALNTNLANVTDLGYLADSKYLEGPALYRAVSKDSYCGFLNNYGVWIRNDNADPINYWVKRKYKIDVKYAGTHNWSFAAASYGYFSIDGTVLGDVRSVDDPYQTERTGTVELTEGIHILELAVVNTGDGGSIGIRISNASNSYPVWSTINPVREVSPYPSWGEVYRIPLTEGENVYRSFSYCLKDRQPAEGNRWGNYFSSDGSMFTVFDDGYGNIEIYFNPKSTRASTEEVNTTLSNIPTLNYYYSPFGNRYSQLDVGPIGNGSETHYFIGFDRFGNVRTSIVPIPTAAPDYSLYVANASESNGIDRIAERAIASVVESALYSGAATAYNAYLISIGAETGFIATGIAEVVGSVLFEAGIVAGIVEGAAIAEGLGILAVVLKVICTKLYRLGMIPKEVFEADLRFGRELREKDPDAYYGYLAWAETVVDWMDGKGKGPAFWNMIFWKKTEEDKIKTWAKFMIKWTAYGAIPWAEEMARQQGVIPESPTAGKMIMKFGVPISRLVGIWRRKTNTEKKPAGVFKGFAITSIFAILALGVSICNLYDRMRKK